MTLSPQQQKLAALLLLLLALMVLYTLIVHPVLSLFIRQGQAISQLEDRLSRYHRLADSLEEMEQELRTLQQQNPSADLYLPEARPTLASAWLQQHLNRKISSSGGQLISVQNNPLNTETPLPGISLDVHLRCETDALIALLHSLESQRPILFVKDLIISTSNRGSRVVVNRTRQSSTQQAAPSLDVRFTLLGYTTGETP